MRNTLRSGGSDYLVRNTRMNITQHKGLLDREPNNFNANEGATLHKPVKQRIDQNDTIYI